MNNIITSFKIATNALGKNRLRTFLTVLGVMIGISSVTVIVSAGDSIEKLVYDQMASFGSDFIQAEVRAPKSSGGSMGQAQGIVITTMNENDRQDILDLPYIDKAYSAVTAQELVSWSGNIKKTLIYGVSADFIEIDEANPLIFSKDEQHKQAREYISKALNPIGRNEVIKKLVDDLPTERVQYFPKLTQFPAQHIKVAHRQHGQAHQFPQLTICSNYARKMFHHS